MSRGYDIPPDRLSAEVARRQRRTRRLFGVMILLAFGSLLVWGRCSLAADRHAEALERGAGALLRALQGDATAWDEAEDAYGDAARGSVWDPYGLLVLELVHQLRKGQVTAPDPGVRTVIDHVAALELAEAAEAAARLHDETARAWLGRLVAELRAQQTGATSSQDP